MSCTVIIVDDAHGEAPSWDRVTEPLALAGHPVVKAPRRARGLREDSAALEHLIGSIQGSVVLVGHAYGGSVISGVDPGCGDIAGLVYVAAYAPEPGESCLSLSAMFPGGELTDEMYSRRPLLERFRALPLWRDRPSWFIFGASDELIPAAAQRYMAKRAGARQTVEIPDAAHSIAASHPAFTSGLIREAATLPRWAEPVIP